MEGNARMANMVPPFFFCGTRKGGGKVTYVQRGEDLRRG